MPRLDLIQVNMPERILKDRVRIVVSQNGVARKLALIGFSRTAPDLYLMLPYLQIDSCYLGIARSRAGRAETIDMEVGPSIVNARARMKITYHASGTMHIREHLPDLSPSIRALRGVPIAELSGQKIFAIELVGFDEFDLAKQRELKREETISISFPEYAQRVKILGYAGYSAEQVTGDYTAPTGQIGLPTVTIQFERPGLPRPLILALYMFAVEALPTDEDRAQQIATCGNVKDGAVVSNLFMRGDRALAEAKVIASA